MSEPTPEEFRYTWTARALGNMDEHWGEEKQEQLRPFFEAWITETIRLITKNRPVDRMTEIDFQLALDHYSKEAGEAILAGATNDQWQAWFNQPKPDQP